MWYLFHMAWQVTRALGATVLCLSLPCCFSFIKLKYAYFTHWIALCRFSSALLSEGENWLDMQEAQFQARKIKLGNQGCLKALCSAQRNKTQKNNLVSKLISSLTKHAELGAQKPAIKAGDGLVQLFLEHGLGTPILHGDWFSYRDMVFCPLGFALGDLWWLSLFAQETINRQYFVSLLLNSKTLREKQVLPNRYAKIYHVLKTATQEELGS